MIELGTEGGEQEVEGELIAETEEMAFECASRQKYPMMFEEPVSIQVKLREFYLKNEMRTKYFSGQ